MRWRAAQMHGMPDPEVLPFAEEESLTFGESRAARNRGIANIRGASLTFQKKANVTITDVLV
jgi:hypothetical protein